MSTPLKGFVCVRKTFVKEKAEAHEKISTFTDTQLKNFLKRNVRIVSFDRNLFSITLKKNL